MVKGYYSKVYTYKFQNNINVNSIKKVTMKMFEVIYSCRDLASILI